MIDLKDFEYDELIEYLTSIGEKKFRAEQIFSWLHKGVESYDEMTNLSKDEAQNDKGSGKNLKKKRMFQRLKSEKNMYRK